MCTDGLVLSYGKIDVSCLFAIIMKREEQMEIRADEYKKLKKQMDEIETEMNVYLDSNQLLYRDADITELRNKVMQWKGVVNACIESARMEKTKKGWKENLDRLEKKIDTLEQKYSDLL